MSYSWFKLHHEMPEDIKLRRFTPQEKWAWVALLCLASKSRDRGVIIGEDDDIADYCEFNCTQDWLYYRDKLIAKGMLEIGGDGNLHILHWEERQYDKPSDRPEAVKERVRKHRANKKSTESEGTVTPCNALQTPSNADVTPQTRLDPEEIREDHINLDHAIAETAVEEPVPERQVEPPVMRGRSSAQQMDDYYRQGGYQDPEWVVERRGRNCTYDTGFQSRVLKYLSEMPCYKGQELKPINAIKWLNTANYPDKPDGALRLDDATALWQIYQAELKKASATPATPRPVAKDTSDMSPDEYRAYIVQLSLAHSRGGVA